MFHTTSPFRPHRASTPEFALEKPAPTPALKPGAGMGLADDTPIPTPDGWTTVGEIGVGQQAFDERGGPCTVVGVHPQGNQPVCQVIFDDSSVLVAGTRHEWLTITDLQRSKIHEGTSSLALWPTLRFFGITTEEVRLSLTHNAGGCIKTNHSIPLAKTLQLQERDLLIDPYLLGLWLGDGSSSNSLIFCDRKDEPYYRQRALAAGENWRIMRAKGNVLSCALSGEPAPRFLTRLRTLGVVANKHVPAIYLRAGAEQRLELMRGLMDSDGHVDTRGQAEYTSVMKRLAHGVLEVALSLGQKATMHPGSATLYGRVVSDKWRILLAPTINLAGLPRKSDRLTQALQQRQQASLPRPAQRYIRLVEFVGQWATTCVAVDSPSHMVLAGRAMIPTLTAGPPST